MKNKIIIALFAVLALIGMSGCSTVSTDNNEVALHYKAGPASAKKFANCVDGADRNYDGPMDKHFYYPSGQRTYSFTGRQGSELKPIAAKTKNQVNLRVSGYITFHLNTDCKTLREFHEKIGQKYGAFGEDSGQFSGGELPDGWSNLLNDVLATPLNTALDNAGLKFDWKTLSYDAASQSAFEADVKKNLPGQISDVAAEYIVIDQVSIQPPEPPADLVNALESAEKAKAENDAQKQKNETARTKYQTYRDCKQELSESSCVLLKLAEDGNVPFYIVPDGSNLNLAPNK